MGDIYNDPRVRAAADRMATAAGRCYDRTGARLEARYGLPRVRCLLFEKAAMLRFMWSLRGYHRAIEKARFRQKAKRLRDVR